MHIVADSRRFLFFFSPFQVYRCQPYIVCLVGQRYGWEPSEVSPQLHIYVLCMFYSLRLFFSLSFLFSLLQRTGHWSVLLLILPTWSCCSFAIEMLILSFFLHLLRCTICICYLTVYVYIHRSISRSVYQCIHPSVYLYMPPCTL